MPTIEAKIGSFIESSSQNPAMIFPKINPWNKTLGISRNGTRKASDTLFPRTFKVLFESSTLIMIMIKLAHRYYSATFLAALIVINGIEG